MAYRNLIFAGDVYLPGSIPNLTSQKEVLASDFGKCDFFICNFEGVLVHGHKRANRDAILVMSEENLDLIKLGNTNIVNLANNHTADMGGAALLNTIKILDRHGFVVLGAGENIYEAIKPIRLCINNNNISLFAFAGVEPHVGSIGATELSPGVAPLTSELVTECVRQEKKNCDKLFLLLHWGREHTRYPDVAQIDYAKRFIDAGADFIIGSHPHMIQGSMEYNGGLVWFSLGNFIFPPYVLRGGSKYYWSSAHRRALALNMRWENTSPIITELFFRIGYKNGIPQKIHNTGVGRIVNEYKKINRTIVSDRYQVLFSLLHRIDLMNYYFFRITNSSYRDLHKRIANRLVSYLR